MVGRTIILTLGFDEKFAIRALMRAAPLKGDKVVVFVPAFRDNRADEALNSLKKFCSTIGVTMLETREVPVTELESAIATIYRTLLQELKEGRRLCFNLSGGMRALILETLAAALAAAKSAPDTKIEVELENLTGKVDFTLRHFALSPPGSLDLDILTCIKGLEAAGQPASLSSILSMIVSRMGEKIPRSTLYRRLTSLVEQGYLKLERRGRAVVYSLTELGRVWV